MYLPAGIIIGYATILSALLTLIRLYFKKYRNNARFVFHFMGSLLCGTFIFVMGGWADISFYLKLVFAALFLAVFIFTVRKRSRLGNSGKTGRIGKWYYVFFKLIFTGIMAFLVLMYFQGRTFPGKAVNLQFPFRTGAYFVLQGGANRVVNPAHRNYSITRYGYSMDISKLYPFGNRAKGIMPLDVKDYAIFGDTVLSPCDGTIIGVEDTVHTNMPGNYNIRYVHGNHVIIQAKGYRVFLAHFIKNSIFVKVGDRVKTGKPIGLAGNSGFSAEPHLHITVIKGYDTNEEEYKADDHNKVESRPNDRYDDYRYTGTSVPFTFNGQFYIINDIISK